MTARLRELAEDWRIRASNLTVDPRDKRRCAIGQSYRDCSDELLSILDAEGDGGAVGEWRDPSNAPVSTPMEQVYFLARCPNDNWSPGGHVHFACSYGDAGICRPVGTNGARPFNGWMPVPSTNDRPTRSGVVSDADVARACVAYFDGLPVSGGHIADPEAMRAALEHFAKGERHE